MTSTLAILAALALTGPLADKQVAFQQPAQPAAPNVFIKGSLVSVLKEVEVPAEEPGRLVQLEVKQGLEVEEGAFLARIDDSLPQAQKSARVYEHQVAVEQATNNINVRYAEAQAKVAQAEYDQAEQSNRVVKNSVPQSELRRLLLQVKTAELRTEQAEHEQEVNRLTALAKEANVKEVDAVIERRTIKATFPGEVVEIKKEQGEWVQPGDVVLRMIRLDLLKVEGFLSAREYSTGQVLGKPVVVEVPMPGNRTQKFNGRIAFVSPEVQAGGEFRVWAEVKNERDAAGHWMMKPGLPAEMTIQIGSGIAGEMSNDRVATR